MMQYWLSWYYCPRPVLQLLGLQVPDICHMVDLLANVLDQEGAVLAELGSTGLVCENIVPPVIR